MVTYKDIAGFPGYRVGDDGSVWSCRPGRFRMFGTEWRRLKQFRYKQDDEYLAVSLTRDGRGHKRSVHLLVLEAFAGPRPTGKQARHLNGKDADNRAENLAWGTISENQQDRVPHGTHLRGSKNPNASTTEAVAAAILKAAAAGHKRRELAKMFNVSRNVAGNIARRRSWRHVQA